MTNYDLKYVSKCPVIMCEKALESVFYLVAQHIESGMANEGYHENGTYDVTARSYVVLLKSRSNRSLMVC